MNSIESVIFISAHVLIWWVFFTFISTNSRFQKHRLWKSIQNILVYVDAHTKKNHSPVEFDIFYKNKKFAIGVIKNEVNYYYSNYSVFINGEAAGIYHVLRHLCLNSYHFETKNGRHESEIISILHAANKVLKKMNKTQKINTDSWNQYSYFK